MDRACLLLLAAGVIGSAIPALAKADCSNLPPTASDRMPPSTAPESSSPGMRPAQFSGGMAAALGPAAALQSNSSTPSEVRPAAPPGATNCALSVAANTGSAAAIARQARLIHHQDLMQGGDAEAGRKLYFERQEANCILCHKVGQEGGNIGPPLSGGATNLTRAAVVDAILFPDAETTKGYETVIVLMKDRMGYTGVIKAETDATLTVDSPDEGLVTLSKSDIESRRKGLSLMPDGMEQALTRQELRDLVEFVATLR